MHTCWTHSGGEPRMTLTPAPNPEGGNSLFSVVVIFFRKCLYKWEELLCICTGEGDSFKLACEGDWATGSLTDSPRGLYGKTLFPFHGQAPVYQHDPGYFGLLREPFPVSWGLQCVPSPVLFFVIGSLTHPEAFLLPENKCLITVLKPWSPLWRHLFKPSNKQCIRWCLSFILPSLCFYFPSGHADKEVKHQKWLSWGYTPKEKPVGYLHLHLRVCSRSTRTKSLPHYRQTQRLPWNSACCLNPAFLKSFSCHKKLSLQLASNVSSLRAASMK